VVLNNGQHSIWVCDVQQSRVCRSAQIGVVSALDSRHAYSHGVLAACTASAFLYGAPHSITLTNRHSCSWLSSVAVVALCFGPRSRSQTHKHCMRISVFYYTIFGTFRGPKTYTEYVGMTFRNHTRSSTKNYKQQH